MNVSAQLLPEPVGSRQSRIFGVLSIVLALTVVGIPFAIISAVVSLVQSSRAKRLAMEIPSNFRKPTNTSMILGVVGLSLSVLLLVPALIVAPLAYFALQGRRMDAQVQQQINGLQSLRVQIEQHQASLRVLQQEELTKTLVNLEAELKEPKSSKEKARIQIQIDESNEKIKLIKQGQN